MLDNWIHYYQHGGRDINLRWRVEAYVDAGNAGFARAHYKQSRLPALSPAQKDVMFQFLNSARLSDMHIHRQTARALEQRELITKQNGSYKLTGWGWMVLDKLVEDD